MDKYPKFLICTNRESAKGRIYLLHTGDPGFIAEIVSFRNLEDFKEYNKKPAPHHTCEFENKQHTISSHTIIDGKVIGLFVNKLFFIPQNSYQEIDLSNVIQRASEWLKNYYKDFK